MIDVYRGGGNGLFGGFNSGLDHKGPSAPYLKFTLGGNSVCYSAAYDLLLSPDGTLRT